jgi:hypothetical protein
MTLNLTPLIPYLEGNLKESAVDRVLSELAKKGYPTMFEPGSALVLTRGAVQQAIDAAGCNVAVLDEYYIIGVDPLEEL